MRARANKEKFEFWPFLLFVAMLLFLVSLFGEAIDKQLAFEDARGEAFKASLVSK